MPPVAPESAARQRVLAACVLVPSGVRSQWLDTIVDADVTELVRELEQSGLLEFRADMLHATDAGRDAHDAAGWSDAQLRELHAALADGIARSSYRSSEARDLLAQQLALAGRTEEAQRSYLARGVTALRSRSPHDALAAFDAAAQLAPLDAAHGVLHAQAAVLNGDERAAEHWQTVVDRADPERDGAHLVRARVELVFAGVAEPATLRDGARIDAGWGAYAQAIERYYDGDWPGVITHAEQTLAVSRARDDLELETRALRIAANAHASIGHLELSARMLEEVIGIADLAVDPIGIVKTGQVLAETRLDLLQTSAALEDARSLERFIQGRGIHRYATWALTTRASVELAAGRLPEALRTAGRALEQQLADGNDVAKVNAALVAVHCMLASGTERRIVDGLLASAEELVESFGYSSFRVWLDLLIGWHALRAGDAAPLVALAGRIDPQQESLDAALTALLLTRDAVQRGVDVPPAAARLRPNADERSPLVLLCWAEIDALVAADLDALADVQARWDAGGRQWDAAICALGRGVIALAAGIEDEAERAALRALRDLLACGAAADAPAARALLRRIGRMPADADGLLGCHAFAALDQHVLAALVHDAVRVDAEAGELILDPDASDVGIVIIGDGIAFVASDAGAAAPMHQLLIVGDAYVDAWYRTETGGAVSPTVLVAGSRVVAWRIPAATVRAVSLQAPRLIGALVDLADTAAAKARRSAAEVVTLDARQRLARQLLRLVDRAGRPTLRGEQMIDLVLTADQLGRLTGSHRQKTSTTLAAWKRDGILDTFKRRTVVVDRAALEREAGLDPSDEVTAG